MDRRGTPPLVGDLPTIIHGFTACSFSPMLRDWWSVYTVQMFSCAISWLFFKWPLSQGMAGQHMETSALTIFLSKQQMALLLSFWSGAKIPMAEVLVYTDAAWRGTAWGFAPPNSSTAYRCFLCNSHFQFVSSCDSTSAGCLELWFFLLCLLLDRLTDVDHGPQVFPVCHLLGSTSVAREGIVELSVWVASGFGYVCAVDKIMLSGKQMKCQAFARCFLSQTRPS